MHRTPPFSLNGETSAERELMASFSAQVGRYKRLSAGERAELLGAAEAGDACAGQRLVEHHLYLVYETAVRYRAQGLDFADLFQAGSEGLIVEVDHYRGPAEGFIEASRRGVVRAIESAIAGQADKRRNDEAFAVGCRALEKAELLLRQRLRRPPLDWEVAEVLEWEEARVTTIREMLVAARTRHDLELLPYLAEGLLDSREDEDESV